jgi:tetratricopeptide (TPR) repeat protein
MRSFSARRAFAALFIEIVFLSPGGCGSVQNRPAPPPLSFPAPPPVAPGAESQPRPPESPRRMASLHLTEKGKSELEKGDLKNAMDRFEKAIGLDSDNAAAYYYFAEARFQQTEYRQSLTLLNRAQQLVDGDAEWEVRIYRLQGKNYEAMGNRIEAIRSYQNLLALRPDDPDAKNHLK